MKRSYRRHRNPKKPEKNEQPFFSKTSDQSKQGSFFQARLKVGQPGDKFEQEADATAQAVVNQKPDQALHKKEKDSIQRVTLATPAEDEKLGTAEARMEKDKYIQEKADPQTMSEEEEAATEVQEMQQPQKEEAPLVQSMEKEEEVGVQKLEEEEPAPQLQSMEDQEEERSPVQKKEEEQPELQSQAEEKEETEVQTKKNVPTSTASGNISSRVKRSKGKGKTLSAKTKEEMEAAFGADFSDVVIHTDPEAQDLNQRLGAQAFTQGKDIYFNTDKYHPETAAGKQLIAHELTHVIQQKGKKKKK